MAGSVPQSVALLALACAALVLAAAVFLLVWRRGLGSMSVRFGSFESKLEAVDKAVAQINKAVNHQPEEAPTLVARTLTIETEVSWMSTAIRQIATHVGCQIPPHPKETS